jgi:ABC-2 type transport system permease protein
MGGRVRKVWTVMLKEFQEIIQQRGLVIGIVVPVVIFIIIPLSAMSGAVFGREANPTGIGPPAVGALAGLTQREVTQALVGEQVAILYLILPTLLTSIIAAYSIIGEKTARTLEPLLATPIQTWELLVGKALVALIPGVLLTWLAGIIFVRGLQRVAVSQKVIDVVASPGWHVTLVIWTPLLAVIAVAALTIVSSRVSDARTAQQLSTAVVLPFLVLFLGQAAGWLTLGISVAFGIAAIILLLAIVASYAAIRMFQREAILTRWK